MPEALTEAVPNGELSAKKVTVPVFGVPPPGDWAWLTVGSQVSRMSSRCAGARTFVRNRRALRQEAA